MKNQKTGQQPKQTIANVSVSVHPYFMREDFKKKVNILGVDPGSDCFQHPLVEWAVDETYPPQNY